jgi:5-methylcytosine-specific restriction protein A
MRGPAWVSDEFILALDVYFVLDHKDIRSSNPLIIELSELLRSLPIHTYRPDEEKFRNPTGVEMNY